MNWFEFWFNRDYLKLYPNRNETEAVNQARALLAWIEGRNRPEAALDIACGSGRHLRALGKALPDLHLVGADLSWHLLTSRRERGRISRVRADMRQLPFHDESFDLVTSFFTSFGYFETDEEHMALLAEWHRVSRGAAVLLLDFLNPEHVLKTLVPHNERMIEGSRVVETRSYDVRTKRIEKSIVLHDGTEERTYSESVRMYRHDELLTMLTAARFRVLATYGDFSKCDSGYGSAWNDESERMVFFAERVAE